MKTSNHKEKNWATRGLEPSPASCGPRRHGVVLSVEALLAALLLFAAMLLASTLAGMAGDTRLPLLRTYTQDLAASGMRSGAWLDGAVSSDDTAARALINNLPAGLCAQAEIYAGSTNVSALRWAYVRGGCNQTIGTPPAQAWVAQVERGNNTNYSYGWVRVRTYPREG